MVGQVFAVIGNFIGQLLNLSVPGIPGFTFLHLMAIGFVLLFVGVIFRITIGGEGPE